MIDEKITSICFGYKDAYDYHYNGACCHKIPGIKVPTLFFNALDDPLIGKTAIDFESIKNNPNCILATNDHGGHMGYFESCTSQVQWWTKPVLDYLYILSI
jgi:uncharacterized protein